ncbi:hypothetical protein FPZ42_16070 [Mucilaginibacter achroorhodeus]|uniref:Cytochrome B n=2 Tax=Mucilaginibacter achroorhodeus TaxID=2599294 RepID=A0A563U0S8_9SPHI|nr:hypothetical protein FPZ42_16070 [Mucilaginibacter achroorhodeus]
MYTPLLALHSATRWLVLLFVIIMLIRSFWAFGATAKYTLWDSRLRVITSSVLHIQLVFGVWLYIISPVVSYFWQHFKQAVHMREIRFFGMEHVFMMLAAIIIMTIGIVKVKRQPTDQLKFKTQLIWFSIGLLIIFTSIPWAFSPLIHRPWIRNF